MSRPLLIRAWDQLAGLGLEDPDHVAGLRLVGAQVEDQHRSVPDPLRLGLEARQQRPLLRDDLCRNFTKPELRAKFPGVIG